MDPRDVHIAEPCTEDWAGMRTEPGDRARHCALCDKRVHDLSAMTETEAQIFLDATAGQDICISYLNDAEGKPRFRPRRAPPRDPVTSLEARPAGSPGVVPVSRLLRPGPRRSMAPAPVFTANPQRPWLGMAMAGALAACTPHGEPEVLEMPETGDEAALRAEVHDAPTIPEARDPAPPPPELIGDTPCDTPPEADAPEKRPRLKGRRPIRKKGKLELPDEDRIMGFI